MKQANTKSWRRNGFEFLFIFIAVISAFGLESWNDNRLSLNTQRKILLEIANGLEKDLIDIEVNKKGHQLGLISSKYFRMLLGGQMVNKDSFSTNYFLLTRDFISMQNIAAYETLKSKGLELIENDSMRLQIITLYEYDYSILHKLEEEYNEMQFHKNYFAQINESLAPSFILNDSFQITGIETPLKINPTDRKLALSNVAKIEENRLFILRYYEEMDSKILNLLGIIEEHLAESE